MATFRIIDVIPAPSFHFYITNNYPVVHTNGSKRWFTGNELLRTSKVSMVWFKAKWHLFS